MPQQRNLIGWRFRVELRKSDVAKFGVVQSAQSRSVEIDETKPAAAQDEIRRQRIVAEGAAAETRSTVPARAYRVA
jgi:hypothetical protein